MNSMIEELSRWETLTESLARKAGLDFYPQEFHMCTHEDMLGYMAYSGMPSHYNHWSYGKGYERLKTLYDYGISGLPYEVVINSNPSIAYLMRDNSLLLHILTMAHVYGHNDFFKNNFTFRTGANAALTIERCKMYRDRVRGYIDDPSIGIDRVEQILDAAHALSLQCRRNFAIKKVSRKEQEARAIEASRPAPDPFASIHKRQKHSFPDITKIPLEPEEDLLLFIRDHNPFLEEWEKDLLTIVHEEAQYFIPQIETKIMNEGWASFWHKRILEKLDLPQGMMLEFMVRHSQVLAPTPGGMNPYYLGLTIWEDIEKRWDNPSKKDLEQYGAMGKTGREKIFEVREVDRDVSFLRRYLTEDLIRELALFEHRQQMHNDEVHRVISKVADKNHWRDIKETLIKNTGMNTIPVIKIADADYNNNRVLYLKHDYDGRDLLLEYAEKTLQHLSVLWRRELMLETTINNNRSLLCYDGNRLIVKGLR